MLDVAEAGELGAARGPIALRMAMPADPTQPELEFVELDAVERWTAARVQHREWQAARPGRVKRLQARRRARRQDRRARRGAGRVERERLGRGPRLLARILGLRGERHLVSSPGPRGPWAAGMAPAASSERGDSTTPGPGKEPNP